MVYLMYIRYLVCTLLRYTNLLNMINSIGSPQRGSL